MTGLTAGTYDNFNVTNNITLCSSGILAVSLALSEPPSATITLGTTQNPSACGLNDGFIQISGLTSGIFYTLDYTQNGTPQTPVTFTASSGNYTLSGLTGGNYVFTVSNTGCKSNALTKSLSDPTTATISLGSKTDPTACSLNDGTFTVSGLAPSTAYILNYTKDGIAQTPINFTSVGTSYNLNGLTKGTYTNIRVTNAGCISNSISTTLSDPGAAIILAGTPNQPSACGMSDGSITINGLVIGNTYSIKHRKDGIIQATISYVATNNSYTITGLGAGAYTKITSSNGGCVSNSITQILADPGAATIALGTVTQPISCGANNGAVIITGLTSGLSYILKYVKNAVQQTATTFTASGTSYNLSGLTAGSYTGINVTQGGCTSNTLDAMLSNPGGPIIDAIGNDAITCSSGNDGSLLITGFSQGLTYTINYMKGGVSQTPITFNSTSTSYKINGLSPDTYTNITATQATCISNIDNTVIAGPMQAIAPTVSATNLSNICLATMADLDDITTSTPPSGTVLTWHAATPATAGNKVSNVNAVGAGTYYASFFNATTGCYGASRPVVVTIIVCTDTDGDGIPDIADLDDDNDGILDTVEDGQLSADTDGDGIPNRLDLDSDNDGINDVIEAGGVDANKDGIADGTPSVTGIPASAGTGSTPPDTDGDTRPNPYDLDSDNDGINDLVESGNPLLVDADGNGMVDGTDPDGDGILGGADGLPATRGDIGDPVPVDTDGDGTPNYKDLDSDGDGISDLKESGIPNPTTLDANNDGKIDSTVDPDGDGIVSPVDGIPNTFGDSANPVLPDTDGDGKPDYIDPTDTDGDGVADAIDLDDDNDGILDTVEDGQLSADTDGDGIPTRLDLDSDNDGINDVIEAGGVDANKDGIADGTPSVTGIPASAGTGLAIPDTDGDTPPNPYDLDSDNDGINDLVESGNPLLVDADGNGMVDGTDPDGDGILGGADGVPATRGDSGDPVPADTDGDGTPNYKDLDSDGDGISDLKESGIPNPATLDANNDGKIDSTVDPDGDGIVGTVDGIPNTFGDSGNPILPDTDGDGKPDYVDPTDTDGDGVADITDLDDDNDGILDTVEDAQFSADTDGDGIPNRLDLDSDNDGINDVIEGGGVDANKDGIADGTPSATGIPSSAGTGLNVPDTDGDTRPNPYDLDSDNDGINDLVESGNPLLVDADGNGMVDGTDPDGDGILGGADGVPATRGDSGDPVPVDTDGDGTPNYKDLDSDGDGISDLKESGIPNPATLDANNDGKIDSTVDPDGDGIVSPVDGIPNTFGDPGNPILPDTDGDGKPDYVDASPTANADNNIATVAGVPTNISVLANDKNADGTTADLTKVTTPTVPTSGVGAPTKGTVTINPDGTIKYTSNANASGTDTFTYTICDKANPTVCSSATVSVNITCTKPVLSIQNITCSGTGTGYTITFSSNATVTTNNGTLSGNTVTVSSGSATLTSTTSCGEVTSMIVTAPTCPIPITCTQVQSLSVGNALCTGTGTYSVSFSGANGTVTSSAGTVSGNTVVNIPIGINAVLTITPTSTACNGQSITVTSPVSCAAPSCTDGSVGISYSTACNSGGTYTINYTTSIAGTTVTSSANSFTNLTESVTLTVTKPGCSPQSVAVSAPVCVACSKPVLSVQNIACSGTGYTITFSSNATVTINNGTLSGNTVTVSSGSATLTSTTSCGEVTSMIVTAPTCPIPITCTQVPSLSVGNALCTGTGTYSVSFSGANGTVTSSAGTVSGNTVVNIPIGINAVLTITPTSTACNGQSITVTSPVSCAAPSCMDGSVGISYSTACNNGGTYTINYTTSIAGTTVTSSANSFTNLTGTVTLTVTKPGCSPQSVAVSAPVCVANTDVKLQLKVFLQGAFFSPSGATDVLMRDNLRTLGVIPNTEPFTAMANSRFTKFSDVGGQAIGAGVLSTTSNDAIVDWVFVELRDATNPATVLKTRAALVQRDGDVVEASDGITPVTFAGAVGASYYVSIKHRNHLGAMTAAAITMSGTGTIVDFTSMSSAQTWDKGLVLSDGTLGSYDGSEQATLGNGKMGLWSGNARNADNKVKYSGSAPDPATLLSQVITYSTNTGGVYNFDFVTPVYMTGDINMDGKVKYAGSGTDTAYTLFNVINKYPNNIINKSYNFDFMIEQIP